jgi:hypothetical protein
MASGAKLPLAKRGMFIILSGKLRATTHWKLSEGYSLNQQAYQSFVFKHLGKQDTKYGIQEPRNEQFLPQIQS